MKKPLTERFWAKVTKTADCWEWTGGTSSGYGAIQRGARGEGVTHAHRLSWEMHNGPIPDGLWVLHRCDNRRCVRPDHLFLGTQQDNNADCKSKGRHAKGETRGFNKLNNQQVYAIRRLMDSGWSASAVGALFSTSDHNVRLIAKRQRWQHLPEDHS